MKRIKITVELECSDKLFEDVFKESEEDILSGKLKKDLEEEGYERVKTTLTKETIE